MVVLSCASELLWRTHFCTWEMGARLSCFWGRIAQGNVTEAGHVEGMCRGFSFRLRKPKGLSGQRLAGAAPVGRRAQGGRCVCVCVRARVANTKVISPCSFFLSVSGGGGPGGVGGRPGRRLRGRAGAEAWSGLWEGSSESLFHIPGVRAREKTVGSTASVSRCRLRERVAPWPGTSVQEAGQAGRGRGAEGRLPALEWWGRGERGGLLSWPLCASRFSRETAPKPREKARSRPLPRV